LSVAFCGIGYVKLSFTIAHLAEMWPWTGQVPEIVVRSLGVVDLLGGIGIVLPSLTKIKKHLTVWAAIGCTALLASAICFHLLRGEAKAVPFNALLLMIALFILWGRRRALFSPQRSHHPGLL